MIHKDVFILGAGFSRGINSLMPLMDELTEAVRNNPDIHLPPPLVDLEGDVTSEIKNDIEMWLSYLYHRQPWLRDDFNKDNEEVAKQITQFIADFIDDRTLCTIESPPPDWLSPLVELWNAQRTSVITLNYDTLVERFVKVMGIEPNHIYDPSFRETFTYLKLHGSINWLVEDSDTNSPEDIDFGDVPCWGASGNWSHVKTSLSDESKKSLIIPPLFEKTTHFNTGYIRSIWQEAAFRLEAATRVFVIGYSLPKSDLAMQFFMKKYLPIKSCGSYQTYWYIINPDHNVIGWYRDLLEPHQTVRNEFICDNPVAKFVKKYPNLP